MERRRGRRTKRFWTRSETTQQKSREVGAHSKKNPKRKKNLELKKKLRSVGRNIIHGSDAVEAAQREIALWFPEGLAENSPTMAKWIYE